MKCLIFGVVNVTPDSFSDGGEFLDPAAAVPHALELAAAGADVLDIGPESSSFHRPGVKPVEPAEQIRRAIPVLERLRKETSVLLSIDTRSAEVARAAVQAGASIINDVSAGLDDPDLLPLAAECRAELILMHRRLEPPGAVPQYHDVVAEVRDFLEDRVRAALQAGVPREKVWVDLGLGFGKAPEHCLALLRSLDKIRPPGTRVLVGASRKRFLGVVGGEAAPRDRLGGSVAAGLWAWQHGADGLRVHDAAATVAALRVWAALSGAERNKL